jgi:hypothetical protein
LIKSGFVDIEATILAVSQPVENLLGVEPATALAAETLLAAGILSTSKYFSDINDHRIRDTFTPAGLVTLAGLGSIDYLAFKGYSAESYVANVISSVADLTIFFLLLYILWLYIQLDWPGKFETWKKLVSA